MKLYRLSHRCLPLFIAITPLNKVTIIIKVLKQSMCDKLIGNLFQYPNDLLNSFFTHLLGLISTRDITAYKVTLQQFFQTSLVSHTDQEHTSMQIAFLYKLFHIFHIDQEHIDQEHLSAYKVNLQ